MSGIILKGNRYSGNTIVSNCFIDEYMAEANGAQLKIYLYLMRCIEADEPVTVPLLADRFNYTETDIIRSLLYWARKGIISLEFDENRNVTGIVLNDPAEAEETEVVLPKKTVSTEKKRRVNYTASDIDHFGSKSEVKQLIFATEQYLSRTLNPTDMNTMLFIYDELGFSTDLLEYLIEYCVGKGKTQIKYIEQTAIGWAENGVKTVKDAKSHVRGYGSNDYFTVLKAFGITDRKPVEVEIEYVDRWQNEYGYEMDMILEAAARTMKAIAKPSFPYTDKILRSWSEEGVRTVDDIGNIYPVWGSASKQAGLTRTEEKKRTAPKNSANSKIHYSLERQYNFDELEAELLKKQRNKRYNRA
ncbi:MAG: DnaD domain protein [Lachnospiraceae bacterium]|nr:DnaD domain protein [Lachnospiraceae bacterium]